MSTCRQFLEHNPAIILKDCIALWLAISSQDEIPTRQLLREFESSYPMGYGKQIVVKTMAVLTPVEKEWLRTLY
jgi:hypothetical protein